MNDIVYWIWLSLAFGVGCFGSDDLLFANRYSAEAIYRAGVDEYADIPSLTPGQVKALLNKDLSEAEAVAEYCASEGIGLLPANSRLYPERLRRIQKKPLLLYYKGSLISLEENVCIAAVGTRSMTDYGRRNAYTISYDLARCGAIVVSGMALGNDGMCHAGALDAGGYTIAVLGCGIDRAYPPEHLELMERIISQGAVMTEYRPFTPPSGRNFPVRNRLISGLSQGTLVVEADAGSGSMITATHALYQGRDIFALPGRAGEYNSEGTNKLLQDGAKIILNAADILEEYEGVYYNKIDMREFSRGRLNPTNLQYSLKYSPPAPAPFGRADNAGHNGKGGADSAAGAVRGRPTAYGGQPGGRPYNNQTYENQPSDNAHKNKSYNNQPFDNTQNNQQYDGRQSYSRGQPKNAEHPGGAGVKQAQKETGGESVIGRLFPQSKKAAPASEGHASNGSGGVETVKQPREPVTLDESERIVYELLSFTEPRTTDYVIKAGVKASAAMVALTFLETKGAVKPLPGGNYVKLPLE